MSVPILASHARPPGTYVLFSPRCSSATAPELRDLGPDHSIAEPSKLTQQGVAALTYPGRQPLNTPSDSRDVGTALSHPLSFRITTTPTYLFLHRPPPTTKMLAVLTVPHSSSSSGASSDASQPWNKVRAWFSRERGRAGRILQVALLGAARAASASTNVVTPTPHRPTNTTTTGTAFENAVWDSTNRPPEMESRLRDTQLTMLDWINIRRLGAEEYRKLVDGALPPIPSEERDMGSRTHAVKVCFAFLASHLTHS
jgi:hypothetical protein